MAEPFSKERQLARGERRYRRKVASPKTWAAIRAEKLDGQTCRVWRAALAAAAAPSGPDEQAETGGEQRSPCAGEPNGDGSIVGLLDAIAEFFGDVPDAVKVMKIGEENGEAVEAFIGMTGANVRKGVTHTEGDLRLELADVVITAYVALAAFSGDTWTVLADRVEVIASRLGIGAAPSGEPPSEQEQAHAAHCAVFTGSISCTCGAWFREPKPAPRRGERDAGPQPPETT